MGEVVRGPLPKVPGFTGAAVSAGIKEGKKGRPDLALVLSQRECHWAGVFTRNKVKAAPVLVDMERMRDYRQVRAVILNSGNANACTGHRGLLDAEEMCGLAAFALDLTPEAFLVCSTGVIGEPMPMERIRKEVPQLAQSLSSTGLTGVAQAIMTTDTRPKSAWIELETSGEKAILAGIAKGAGMIGPDMGPHATMLSLILTDLTLPKEVMQDLLNRAVDHSFNRIMVDGDTSTNDTVLFLANGLAGGLPLESSIGDLEEPLKALTLDLALQIVEDGEGVTKVVKIEVKGAATSEEAEAIARTVGTSPLVKTAFYGEDPNWGRIMAAAGRSGATLEAGKCDIWVDNVLLVENGEGKGKEQEAKAAQVMKKTGFQVTIDLKLGSGEYWLYTTDLSTDYVHINADYRS